MTETPGPDRSDPHSLAELADDLAGVNGSVQRIHRQLDTLRREMLGDRKWAAHTSALLVLVALTDQLDAMRAGLDPERDVRVLAQLDGIAATLTVAVRALGFEPFHAAVGEPFEPGRMECVGRAAGASGVVLRAARAGYRAGDVVLRVAGVVLADP